MVYINNIDKMAIIFLGLGVITLLVLDCNYKYFNNTNNSDNKQNTL